MPLIGISTGKDNVVTITDSNGVVNTCRIKEFASNQKVNARETQAMDGLNRHANFAAGWQGSFMMERTDASMDAYIAQYENIYYQGGVLPKITLQITIQEASGSVSQYQFFGVQFHFEDAGTYKSDDFVYQKMSFVASTRKVLS